MLIILICTGIGKNAFNIELAWSWINFEQATIWLTQYYNRPLFSYQRAIYYIYFLSSNLITLTLKAGLLRIEPFLLSK